MSLEQTVYLVHASVPQRGALQGAVDALGFDCKLDEFYAPFVCEGFLPCVLNGNDSGFEIYFEPAAEMLKIFPALTEPIGQRDVAITFRWGGDMAECACALIVSAALASAFDAIVHYHNDDILYSTKQLVEEARAALGSI